MSSQRTNIPFKSILHQVLKMTPFWSYTGDESRTPLIYRFVYDVLSNAVPHTQQALTQLVDVVIYAFLVDPRRVFYFFSTRFSLLVLGNSR